MNHEIYHVDENNVLLFPFAQSSAHDVSGLPNDIISDKDGKLIPISLRPTWFFIVIPSITLSNA